MQKEEIINLISKKPNSYVQIIKANHRDFYDKVSSEFTGESFGEKLYRFIYGKKGICYCGNKTKFKSFVLGYNLYCSKKCSNNATKEARTTTRVENNKLTRDEYYITKPCQICGDSFESLKFRKQKCCSAKCSGIYVASKPDRVKKIKKTKLERYGTATYVNPEKAKETCFEKYGVDNVFKFREIKDDIKKSNLEKYGNEFYFSSEEGKDKVKKTILEKYGVENIAQNEDIKEKVKQSFIEKYGVDNVFKDKKTMEKVYRDNIEKYGTKIPVNGGSLKEKMLVSLKITLYKNIISRLDIRSQCKPLFSLEEYVSTDKENKYKFQCSKCDDIFEDHIDGGHLPRCLKCNPYIAGFSYDEKEISDYVKSLTVESVIENDRSVLNGMELDIYIPSKKIAIEYDGLHWHSECGGGKDKNYHLNKTSMCDIKGIRLIHIFEDEWVYNKDIIKSKLKHILQEDKNKPIYARNCEIENITDCKDFLNKNHIQGDVAASIKLGAFYKEELVAVMTFGKKRVALGNTKHTSGEYELLRFATSKRVIGIANKLFSYFTKKYNPNKITTFADKRYSVGNLYEKMNFKFVADTKPNYWYFKRGGNIRWHRYGFAKHNLSKRLKKYDDSLSEWQNMQLNDYDRIWDCGNKKYEWIKIT